MIDPRCQISKGVLSLPLEWCRVTLASIGDAIITTDIGGRITFINQAAASLTGWIPTKAVGLLLESVFKIVNQESRRIVESPTVRALREGMAIGLANHTLLIAKNGSECPIDDSAAPICNERGEVIGVVLVFRDITKRYFQEQRTRDALGYADNIIATLREPFLVLDKDLRVKMANSAFYQTFKVRRKQTEGHFVYKLGNGQWNISQLRRMLAGVLANNRPICNFEMEQDFPTIGSRIMLLNVHRFYSTDGQPEILFAIEDITERRRRESALRASEARYRRLFESAREGILIVDAGTLKIIDANPFMTELLGYSHGEFIGKELLEIGLIKDQKDNQAIYQKLQQHDDIHYDHLSLETKQGKPIEVELIGNIYQMGARKVAQCNLRDMSQRGRLERQLQAQAKALADLHHRKDEFLAMLSHELRNPLAPLMNAVYLLRLEQENESLIQQQARTIIERQIAQLTHLVDDLLEVSRVITGKIHLRQEQVDANVIAEHAAEVVHPLINQRRHEFTVSLSPRPIWLNGDSARLEQVLVNLLTNAAKYTDKGGHIGLTVQQAGNECVLRVQDTGVGIAPELLPHVFDLFIQAERSLDRSHGGLGIGLSLVQRLVELHQGTVEAYSTLGQGSEFIVRLPVIVFPKSQPPLPNTEKARPMESALRVLVVDDRLDSAESLALLLRASGYQVHVAYDGPSAVEIALSYQPDVVLLDIGLPGIDGYEVARRIRQQSTLKNICLVAVTGYGQETDRQRSRKAGFEYHLAKPADFSKIQQILATVKVR